MPRVDTEQQGKQSVDDRHSTTVVNANDDQQEHQSDEPKQERLEDAASDAGAETEQIGERVTGDEQISVAATASVQLQPASSSSSSTAAAAAAAAVDSEEQVDIDLADPEVQKAAVFIQSSFKGFKQRKSSQGLSKVDCPDLLN